MAFCSHLRQCKSKVTYLVLKSFDFWERVSFTKIYKTLRSVYIVSSPGLKRNAID